MKNLSFSFVFFSLFFFLPILSSANNSLKIEAELYAFEDCGCPSANVELSDYFKVKIKYCNNKVTAKGYLFGNKSGEWSFSDNGSGMFEFQKDNGLIGFKIYVEKSNGRLWYKTGHRRGADDPKFNWSKRRRL